MWFDMTPATLEWTRDAHSAFHNEAILDATPEQVFDILADIDQWEIWLDEVEEVEWLSDGQPGVGARRLVRLDIMEVKESFIAWEPGLRYTFTMTAATLPLAERLVEDYRLEAVEGGRCRLNWDVYYDPKWYLKSLNPLLSFNFSRMFEQAIRSLAAYVRKQTVGGR